MLNERKGYHPHYPVFDCCWRGRGGENYGRFGGRFTRRHVPLMFSPHRDGLRRHGGSGDRMQGKPPIFTPCRIPQIQHSHRHDDMQFMILADEELVKFSDYPVLPGITTKLVQANDQAKKWRSRVLVGCKHCISNPRKYSSVWVGNVASYLVRTQSPPERPKLAPTEKSRSPARNQSGSNMMAYVPT